MEKEVKKQLEELKVAGVIPNDPYIRVTSEGKVVTVDSKIYKRKMERLGKILIRNTRLFHLWFHSGKWIDCNRELCRSVIDEIEELGLEDWMGEEEQ